MEFKRISKCCRCGLMFANVQSFDPAQVYDERYFKGKVYRDYIREEPNRIRLFKEKFNMIRRHLPKEGRVLDIGCAAGFFLKVMSQMGYEVYGVDISEYALGYVRERSG